MVNLNVLRYLINNPFHNYIKKFIKNIPSYNLVSCLISNRGITTNLHIDAEDGIQMTLFGKKRWYIFNPKDIHKLGITIGRRSKTIHGKFNKNLLMKGIKYKIFETSPGNIIYIKAGDPHIVDTLEDESVTIGFRTVTKLKPSYWNILNT